MHTFGLVVSFLVAAFWVFHGLRVAYGAKKLPWMKDFAPAEDAACPSISLIFAARDEEEKLPAALATLAVLDYPALEIIAADRLPRDWSGDSVTSNNAAGAFEAVDEMGAEFRLENVRQSENRRRRAGDGSWVQLRRST